MIIKIILGILAIIWGIYELIDTYKSQQSENTWINESARGYVGGIGLITVGLFLIFDN